MITLSSPITTQTAAPQSGWCEIYDFYLKSAITTPWGTVSVLRLCDLPGGAKFFTPKISPEPAGTQGNAQAYNFWPIKRAAVRSDAKFTADKMQISASNTTTDFASMVAAIDWYDTPVIIRKISTTVAAPTADDCAILWSGLIDEAQVKEKTIQFGCSSDMATLAVTAPRENMHMNCRFSWGDDQCTAIRFHPDHYKFKTVGASNSPTIVSSPDLTEDTVYPADYVGVGDIVNPLSNGSIVASSDGYAWVAQSISYSGLVGSGKCFNLANHLFALNDPVVLGGSPPAGFSAGPTYYVIPLSPATFTLSATSLGPAIPLPNSSGSCTLTSSIVTKSYAVKTSVAGYWTFSTAADWGTETAGFWQVPDAQVGASFDTAYLLKPYITFDFGSAVAPKHWRISNVLYLRLEQMSRFLTIHGSSDNTNSYQSWQMAMPPVGGIPYDLFTPDSSAYRYWRICVRSRWGQALYYPLLNKVQAFTGSRHYWQFGRITFAANTTTVALRNVSRRVLESWGGGGGDGTLKVVTLPTSPVPGDTFYIERGCGRTFNACSSRKNVPNFGGFLDLPYQTIIR